MGRLFASFHVDVGYNLWPRLQLRAKTLVVEVSDLGPSGYMTEHTENSAVISVLWDAVSIPGELTKDVDA